MTVVGWDSRDREVSLSSASFFFLKKGGLGLVSRFDKKYRASWRKMYVCTLSSFSSSSSFVLRS